MQKTLEFTLTAYGIERTGEPLMGDVAKTVSERLESHRKDVVIGRRREDMV